MSDTSPKILDYGIEYYPLFTRTPDADFIQLSNEVDWQRRDNTPRMEYYTNLIPVPYAYGRGRGVREYQPQPIHPLIETYRSKLMEMFGVHFEVCFGNFYENQKDHLGYHADDSPEMDDLRPIAIVSLGVEREIWFRPQDNKEEVMKLKLGHGSLCLMPAGLQLTHYHRIPKASFECGERLSLTFRGYVTP